MKLSVFRQEEFFEDYEFSCELMLALSGAEPMTQAELTAAVGGAPDEEWEVGYTPSSGYPELRRAIAELNPPAETENVLVTVGAIEALLILHNLLLEPGDEVVCLWPAYQPLYELANGAGGSVRFVKLSEKNGFRIDPAQIEAAVSKRTRVVLLNVPHNPTGQTLPPEDLQELACRLEPRGVTLVVDEVFREMRRDHHPSAWNGQENLIVLGSMSKSYALPGLRIGWMVAAPDLVVQARQFRKYTSLNPGSRDQQWALAALESRTRVLERTWRITEDGADIAARWLAQHEEDFDVVVPPAGGLFFPRLKREVPTLDFCADLVDATGVLLAPGSVCYESEGYLRLGVATPDLAAGLDRLDSYLRQTREGEAPTLRPASVNGGGPDD